jgi:hypothetical protein
LRQRDADPRSAALRRSDGAIFAAAGPHAAAWRGQLRPETSGAIVVPVTSAAGLRAQPPGAMDRLARRAPHHVVAGAARAVVAAGVGLHLNPINPVPERLRDAFDA